MAPALSGKGNLIPTAALYALFTTSFPAFPPDPSDFLWRPAVRAERDAPHHLSLHPGWGSACPCSRDIPRMSPGALPADVLGEGRADRTSGIKLLRSTARGKQPKHRSRSILGKAAEQTLNQNPGVTVQQKPHISFINYLTVCLRARKYTPNAAQTTRDAESTELQGAEENP